MKKKNILFVLGCIFIFIMIGVMLIFVFSGDNGDENNDSTILNVDGNWMVAAYIQDGNVTLPNSEFFVFSNNMANAYRGGDTEPYATSSFSLTASSNYPNMEMTLSDISRKYTVSAITDNYIRLYESSSVYMELIRYANDDLSIVDVNEDVLIGTWNVVYRNTAEVIAEEKLQFSDSILNDYRNGAAEPVASVEYYWNDAGYICVDALGVEMSCFPLNEDILFFVENGTGYVWELHKTD